MAASPTLISLGYTVPNLRSAKGLSQENLAETTGLDRSYISRIEIGAANPTFNTLNKIADEPIAAVILMKSPIEAAVISITHAIATNLLPCFALALSCSAT